MKCSNCGNNADNVSKFQKRRNKNFFCNRECYIAYINRDKIDNIDFFKEIDTPEKAYWLGFIVADGNVNKNGFNMQINLNAKDGKHLQKLADVFGKKVKYTNYYNKNKGTEYQGVYLCVSSKKLCSDLNSLGMLPNKTDLNQSSILKNINDKMFPHFVRGIFDGDGSISYSTVRGKFICNTMFCGEKNIMMSLKERLIKSIGFRDTKDSVVNKLTIIRWGGRRQAYSLNKFMYDSANVFLKRKKHIFDYLSSTKPKSDSNYFGVTKAASGKWNSYIFHNGKRRHLGNFLTSKEAAIVRDREYAKLGKSKYKLNFPEGS